jgi:hypothetical protein
VSHLATSAGPNLIVDVGLITSGISILIATYAIWQAWVIFRISNVASKEAEHSTAAVGESVRKLEVLFDHLHTDMLGLLREIIGDMRRHAWHEPPSDRAGVEGQSPISHESARARREAVAEVSALAERAGASDAELHELKRAVRRTLDKAIDSSLQTERVSAQDAIRSQLTATIDYERRCGRTAIRADDLLGPLFERFDPEEVHRVLASMRKSGTVDWDPDDDYVEQADVIVYLAPEALAPQLRRGLALAR